jgi:hypothetical protein
MLTAVRAGDTIEPMTYRPPAMSRPGTNEVGASRPSPWRPDVARWALLELRGRVDTLVDDPFFFLDAGRPLVVGRSSSAADPYDLRVRDHEVSRTHCELYFERGAWWVRDLSSTNGTRVDGVVVRDQPARLTDECTVSLGSTRLSFRRAEGDGEALVRSLCENRDTSLPSFRPLVQACSRASRRDTPAHLALFAPRNSQYSHASGLEEIVGFLNALRTVAEATTPESAFVGHVDANPQSIAILFRRTPLDAVRALLKAWHEKLLAAYPHFRANCALVSLRGALDHPLHRAREKLVACELAGDGALNDEDVDVEWCKEDIQRIRRSADSRTHRWYGVGSFQSSASASADDQSRTRRDVARAVMALPSGARVSVAWQSRAGLFFLAVDAERADFARLLSMIRGLSFIQAEQPESAWIDARVAELEARRLVDVDRMPTPLVLLLGSGGTASAARFLEAARRLEAALRFVAAVWSAKLAQDFNVAEPKGRGEAFYEALEALTQSRTRTEGAATYLTLLQNLARSGSGSGALDPLRQLVGGPWFKRALGACMRRNDVAHRGAGLDETVHQLERALRDLAQALVSPGFQVVDVVDAIRLRNPVGGTFDIERLVGPVPQAERVERTEFTDRGVSLIDGEASWISLTPWVTRRRCPHCGFEDVFVVSPLVAHHDRPLRYHGTVHSHDFDAEHDAATVPLQTLLLAAGNHAALTRTVTGLEEL